MVQRGQYKCIYWLLQYFHAESVLILRTLDNAKYAHPKNTKSGITSGDHPPRQIDPWGPSAACCPLPLASACLPAESSASAKRPNPRTVGKDGRGRLPSPVPHAALVASTVADWPPPPRQRGSPQAPSP
jgi:hypothetical protein